MSSKIDGGQVDIDINANTSNLESGLKKSQDSVKKFAKGFVQQAAGIDGTLSAIAGGPVAIGAMAADTVKKAVAALNDMAAEYRVQEQLEYGLAAAAQNNPYINGAAVEGLKKLANEIQSSSMLDSERVLAIETRLVSMGKTSDEINKIIRAATDIDASGMMQFESAAVNLAKSTFGITGQLGKMNAQVTSLSEEELKAGKAIDIFAEQMKGQALASMETGAGKAKRLNDEIGDLRKSIGEGWEHATEPMKSMFTEIIASMNTGIKSSKELKSALETIKKFNDGEDIKSAELLNALLVKKNALLEQNAKLEKQALIDQQNGSDFGLDASYKKIASNTKIIEGLESEIAEYQKLADAEQAEADAAAKARAEEEKVIENQQSIAEARKKSAEELKKEIAQIELEYEIQGKTADVEEKNKKILDATISSYKSLVKEIGTGQAEEKRRLTELQAQYTEIYGDIASETKKARLRTENLKALEKERAIILDKARLNGEAENSLEVQKRLIEAEEQSYYRLLDTENGILTGLDEEERDRWEILKNAKEQLGVITRMNDEHQKAASALGLKEKEGMLAQLELTEKLEKERIDAQQKLTIEEAKARGDTATANKILHDAEMDRIQEELDEELKNINIIHDARVADKQNQLEELKKSRGDNVAEIERQIAEIENATEEGGKEVAQKIRDGVELSVDERERFAEHLAIINSEEAKIRDKNIQDLQADIDREAEIRNKDIQNATEAAEAMKKIAASSIAAVEPPKGTAFKRVADDFNKLGEAIKGDWAKNMGDMTDATSSALQSMYEDLQDIKTKYYDRIMGLFSAISEYEHASKIERISERQEELEQARKDDEERLASGQITEEELAAANEKRADEELKLKHEGAIADYKLQLDQWRQKLADCVVNGALGAVNAVATAGNIYAGIALAAVVQTMMAFNLSTMQKNMPKPPKFHSGGIVQGRGEQTTTLMGGEVVETQKQFEDQMALQSELAKMFAEGKSGGSAMTVVIENHGAAVSEPQMDGDVIRVMVAKEVNDLLGVGALEKGMSKREDYNRGTSLETY